MHQIDEVTDAEIVLKLGFLGGRQGIVLIFDCELDASGPGRSDRILSEQGLGRVAGQVAFSGWIIRARIAASLVGAMLVSVAINYARVSGYDGYMGYSSGKYKGWQSEKRLDRRAAEYGYGQ